MSVEGREACEHHKNLDKNSWARRCSCWPHFANCESPKGASEGFGPLTGGSLHCGLKGSVRWVSAILQLSLPHARIVYRLTPTAASATPPGRLEVNTLTTSQVQSPTMSSDIPLLRISGLAPPFSGDVKGLVLPRVKNCGGGKVHSDLLAALAAKSLPSSFGPIPGRSHRPGSSPAFSPIPGRYYRPGSLTCV